MVRLRFINNMLVGRLSAEMVKEGVEKNPPPENFKNLPASKKKRVSETGIPGRQSIHVTRNSCISQLVISIRNSDTPNTRDVLNHVMHRVGWHYLGMLTGNLI